MKEALVLSLLSCAVCSAQPACGPTATATSLGIEMCWTDFYSRAYGVPLELVQAVTDVESAWQPLFPQRAPRGSCN